MPATTAAFSMPGSYVLRLTANDSALSASDDVQIILNGATSTEVPSVPLDGGETRIIPCMDPSNLSHQANIPICINANQADSGSISIYSKRGKEIFTRSMDFSTGRNQFVWDGREKSGDKAASGIYLVKIIIGNRELLTKVAVIK
jgi:hypothetical protein